MSKAYSDWHDARAAAERRTRTLDLPTGIEKMQQYGKTVYIVRGVPIDPRKRFGPDARCEVVEPAA